MVSGSSCKELGSHNPILTISEKLKRQQSTTHPVSITEERTEGKPLPPGLERQAIIRNYLWEPSAGQEAGNCN